jgi:hypothetical protein
VVAVSLVRIVYTSRRTVSKRHVNLKEGVIDLTRGGPTRVYGGVP